jgi:phosphotransferase system HPr-like phosphotransfer protein
MIANNMQDVSDDTGIFFAFDDEIPKDTEVHVRLHSEGFTNRGVFFELSDEALHDNVTILDGEKTGDANQIFHVMCLSARENDDIELRLEGPDEVAEARMLEQYVRERF